MIELKNLIAAGEGSHLEFKSEQVKPDDLAKEIVAFLQDSGMVHYETTPIPNTSLKDLNWQRLLDYFLNLHPAHLNLDDEDQTSRNRMLQNLDILSQAGGPTTVVGMLMFGLQPERYLPQSEVRFAHFKGKEIGDELLDRKNLTGPLPQIIEDALRVLNLNLQNASKIEGAKRIEHVIFPSDEIHAGLWFCREAWPRHTHGVTGDAQTCRAGAGFNGKR